MITVIINGYNSTFNAYLVWVIKEYTYTCIHTHVCIQFGRDKTRKLQYFNKKFA